MSREFYSMLEGLELDALLVTRKAAGDILGVSANQIRWMEGHPTYGEWVSPAIKAEGPRSSIAVLYWRHRIEMLAWLKQIKPHGGGSVGWEPPTDSEIELAIKSGAYPKPPY